ncbi:MAG: NADH-quinone oxidoreductase subunit A [Anaerolineae bacterium]|nr:MAG: NADH-quinone oxidoreductase subunit A [Anaerolineae bacterium]
MPAEYLPLVVLFIISTVLSALIVALGHMFGPRRPSARKAMPYESGMRPIGPGSRRVRVAFYLMAVDFILFDLEVVFFLPWVVRARQLGAYGLAVIGVFTFLLLVGFVYAWKKGALEWE